MRHTTSLSCATLAVAMLATSGWAGGSAVLDQKVQATLDRMRGRWHDMNVPEQDGRILYQIVIDKGYTRGLEIGTSTGRSALWTGWAMSKTGGKLTTIEIDAGRHRQAVELFAEAGLAPFIDARLADAHDLVQTLPGPFDFVFIDADKEWYTNYAKAVIPKLTRGGCLAAHNVDAPGGPRGMPSTDAYYAYMRGLPQFDTSVRLDSVRGVCVSYRRKEQ